ncbi:DUF4124 domain-containing protein [Geomonas sp.]|uniref:DUF4124 domain-containing protein n=1 Tax=Geomonas sp. TaxID=2651584 RepID=UPI002B4A7DA0|nr:DUF4124 domain-containing protein [Geomonas sp.]HJV35344.1 DUF4124 domain-containing protein [Geomonas sp.]
MKKLIVALILLYALPVLAETYEWTDQQGTVHFTEDLGSIPKKYRKKAKVVGGDESAPEVTISNEPAKGAAKAEPKGDEGDKPKKLYGGKDEAAWRTAFRNANYEVQQTETELATLQGRMNDTSKMSRSEYLAVQNTIKHTEVRLQEARQKLDALQATANRAGVPPEFRK